MEQTIVNSIAKYWLSHLITNLVTILHTCQSESGEGGQPYDSDRGLSIHIGDYDNNYSIWHYFDIKNGRNTFWKGFRQWRFMAGWGFWQIRFMAGWGFWQITCPVSELLWTTWEAPRGFLLTGALLLKRWVIGQADTAPALSLTGKSGTHPCSPVWKLCLFCNKTLTFGSKMNHLFAVKHRLFSSNEPPFSQ